MGDEEPDEDTPRPRRPREDRTPPPSRTPRRAADRNQNGGPPERDRDDQDDRPRRRRASPPGGVGEVARKAATEVAALTGQQPETVSAIERCDDGWQIGIEVVETRRIPDSADILATYEVKLDAEGELLSYRRTRRYARGQLHGGS